MTIIVCWQVVCASKKQVSSLFISSSASCTLSLYLITGLSDCLMRKVFCILCPAASISCSCARGACHKAESLGGCSIARCQQCVFAQNAGQQVAVMLKQVDQSRWQGAWQVIAIGTGATALTHKQGQAQALQ